ncbi:MAG: hypothetical protein Kow0089_07770 [Desulfobulbaceae bacterium]
MIRLRHTLSRKTLILAGLFCFTMLTGSAWSEEMKVNLQSGNTLVIRYTGTIQGVTMQGGTDGIAGIEMAEKAQMQPATMPHPDNREKGDKVRDNSDGNEIRLKWADPIGEDQPFPRR